jgi:hypothetical protein
VKDNEARGVVLKKFYELRTTKSHLEIADFEDTVLSLHDLGRILEQLAEQRLIDWNPRKSSATSETRYMVIFAKITSFGVDVIEGTTKPPIAISIDNSVTVHGSHGVQIGGQGNVQNVTLDVERLNTFIDSSSASITEKEEAKGLLKRLAENPLVKGAIDWFVKIHTGE